MAIARPETLRRILAIRLDNAGDVVMLGPSLRAIRAAAPEATITLLCSPAGALAAPLLPWVDEAIVTRAPWQDLSGETASDPGRVGRLVDELAARRFDAAFVFTSFSQSPWPPALVAFLAGIPLRIGQAADFGGVLLTHAVPPLPGAVHQVDRNARVVEGFGIAVPDRRLEVRIGAEAREAARRARAEAGVGVRPYLVAAPGASAAARRMPVERLAPAIRAIARERRLAVVVTGSEPERGDAAWLAAAAGGVSLAGATDLPALAATIGEAALVVTAHSVPVHLADALGTPVVVAFSGTDLEPEWRPRRARSVLLRVPTPCAPCRRFSCPYGLPCLDVSVAGIVAAARSVLDRTPVRHAPVGIAIAPGTSEAPGAAPRATRKEDAWIATRS